MAGPDGWIQDLSSWLAKPESLGCLFMPGTSSLDRPNDVDFVKLLNQHIPPKKMLVERP